MLRNLFMIALTLTIAIGGGTASVWYALRMQEGVGAVTIGDWTAYPDSGTPEADPYSRARVAREGHLTLGRAEGLVFVARADSGGEALVRNCNYTIEGTTPPARFWTLYAADEQLAVLAAEGRRPPATQSHEILRQADNSFLIGIGPHPVPGNWIRASGSGRMALVMTLYDTPIASNSGVADIALPQVLRNGCDA